MEQGIFELLGEGFLKQDKMDYVSKKNILLCETCVLHTFITEIYNTRKRIRKIWNPEK